MQVSTGIKPEQKAWLQANYMNYTNSTMAKMLKVKQSKVDYWIAMLGLKKKDAPVPLESWQKDFIRENYNSRSAKEMAIELGIKATKVQTFIHDIGLKKASAPIPKKKRRIVRAKPDHQNMCHEERITFWLNFEIPKGPGRVAYPQR